MFHLAFSAAWFLGMLIQLRNVHHAVKRMIYLLEVRVHTVLAC